MNLKLQRIKDIGCEEVLEDLIQDQESGTILGMECRYVEENYDDSGYIHDDRVIQHIFSLDGELFAIEVWQTSWDVGDVKFRNTYPVKKVERLVKFWEKID